MQLFLNRTSPYARVARIVALEKGLESNLLLLWSDPWADEPDLLQRNPVGRVPILVTDDGQNIAESLLIALYLDQASDINNLIPANDLAQTLHIVGLGQGLMDASFSTMIMRKHHGNEIDASILGQRRQRAIERTLLSLNETYSTLPADRLTLAEIVVAVALDYIAFRLPQVEWQQKNAALIALHERMKKRESFSQTVFA